MVPNVCAVNHRRDRARRDESKRHGEQQASDKTSGPTACHPSGIGTVIETDPAKVRPTERPHLQANVTKLQELIGWSPKPDLRATLIELLTAEGLIG